VTKPFPLTGKNAVEFHPVSLANTSLDLITGIAVAGPTAPTLKLPPNAVSPASQTATALAKLLVKTLLFLTTLV
jgi:predicted solute-binding protein